MPTCHWHPVSITPPLDLGASSSMPTQQHPIPIIYPPPWAPAHCCTCPLTALQPMAEWWGSYRIMNHKHSACVWCTTLLPAHCMSMPCIIYTVCNNIFEIWWNLCALYNDSYILLYVFGLNWARVSYEFIALIACVIYANASAQVSGMMGVYTIHVN